MVRIATLVLMATLCSIGYASKVEAQDSLQKQKNSTGAIVLERQSYLSNKGADDIRIPHEIMSNVRKKFIISVDVFDKQDSKSKAFSNHQYRKMQQRNNQNNKQPNKMPPAPENTPSQNNMDEVFSAAQEQLQSYFDNLHNMQATYGPDIITIQDATDVYPILAQSYINLENCPFEYNPPQSWLEDGQSDTNDHHPKPCYTPIITIQDRIANSWGPTSSELPEVLILSGLEGSSSQDEMDLFGPSSILETLHLLLECARCESLSPWVAAAEINVDGKSDDTVKAAGETVTEDRFDGAAGGGQSNETITNKGRSKHSTTNAVQCRNDLESQGVTVEIRQWIARLASTRRIVFVPIVDVAGFYKYLVEANSSRNQQKGDVHHDSIGAECDFPFPFHASPAGDNNGQSNICMTTYSARLVNELIRSHSFQLGVSFHGQYHGDSKAGAESTSGWIEVPSWNPDPNNGIITFDEKAMSDLGYAYSQFGRLDQNPDHGLPPVRTITTTSQRDKGAMLGHFAFSAGMAVGNAAGVNNDGSLWMQQCQCAAEDNTPSGSDHDGNTVTKSCAYDPERTGMYDGSSLRALIARVVTPQPPWPIHNSGEMPGFYPGYDSKTNQSVLNKYADPISQNTRMSLLAMELVEPWTAIRSIAGVSLKDDGIIPLSKRVPGSCMKTRVMEMPESSLMSAVSVTWTVGGALEVAETAVMYGKWDVLDKKIFDCMTQPTKQELDAFFTILRDFEVMEGETAEEMAEDINFSPVESGVTRWHYDPNNLRMGDTIPTETAFSVSLDLSHYKVGDFIAIYSLARTDQGWVFGDSPIAAQSNVVNARTNPKFTANGNSVIKGHLDWFSVPVTIEIGPQPGFFEGNDPVEKSVRMSDQGYQVAEKYDLKTIVYSLFMAVLVIAITFVCVFCREERDGTDICSIMSEHRKITRQKISMDDFFASEQLELTTTTTDQSSTTRNGIPINML